MDFTRLKSILENGGKIEYVKITDNFPLNYEESADPNMICDIVGISYSPREAFILRLDFEKYRKYNESIAKHDWFDDNGNASITWFETSFYPENGIVTLYIDYWRDTKEVNEQYANNILAECFDFSGTNEFIKEYASVEREESYVEWLESELKKARN